MQYHNRFFLRTAESNARLFVGRRRLDLINEFLADLEKDSAACAKKTNDAWKKLVQSGKMVLQVAGKVPEMASHVENGDLVAPWKNFDKLEPMKFR